MLSLRWALFPPVASAWFLAGVALAEPAVFEVDAEASVVRFTLGATLHTVHGKGRVLAGSFRFDLDAGDASGRAVVEARSLQTGNGSRDEKMHTAVLMSEAHPEIVFEAQSLTLRRRTGGGAEFLLGGELTLLGEAHSLNLPVTAAREPDGRWRARAAARIPYVAWGLRDPSVFLFGVDPEVDVEVEIVGRIHSRH